MLGESGMLLLLTPHQQHAGRLSHGVSKTTRGPQPCGSNFRAVAAAVEAGYKVFGVYRVYGVYRGTWVRRDVKARSHRRREGEAGDRRAKVNFGKFVSTQPMPPLKTLTNAQDEAVRDVSSDV